MSQAEDGKKFTNGTVLYSIHSDTYYDGLGRVRFVTNPYRSSQETTNGWTRTAYDQAGRVTEVATFSGPPTIKPPESGTGQGCLTWTGSVTTDYQSEQTTVTDQAGKTRRSTVDGLGRLITVEELNSGGGVYATTSYEYDARGNLLEVQQGGQNGQTRTFTYDGLSRLKTVLNPEQVNGSGQMVATQYGYDENSNLVTKTDP